MMPKGRLISLLRMLQTVKHLWPLICLRILKSSIFRVFFLNHSNYTVLCDVCILIFCLSHCQALVELKRKTVDEEIGEVKKKERHIEVLMIVVHE